MHCSTTSPRTLAVLFILMVAIVRPTVATASFQDDPALGTPVMKTGYLFNTNDEPIVGLKLVIAQGGTRIDSTTTNYLGAFTLIHPAAEGEVYIEQASHPAYNKNVFGGISARRDVNLDTLRATYGGGRVTDIDGNVYRTVVIDQLVWMAQNLKVLRYNNGDEIPWLPVPADWAATNTNSRGAFAIHSFDYNVNTPSPDTVGSAKFVNRGPLYNWYAVNDSRGLCPTGMRIPTDEDWKALERFIGLPEAAMNATTFPTRGNNEGIAHTLRATSGRWWEGPNHDATDTYGLSIRSASMRFQLGAYGASTAFEAFNRYATFWTSTENNATTAFRRMFHLTSGGINRQATDKRQGASIMCVRNFDPLTDTSVEEQKADVPTDLRLMQNFPNPFNPTTQIAFELPQQSNVRLAVYDMLGREVAVLVNETRSAGSHQVTWNAGNMASGVYLYQLTANGQSTTRRMLLMK